MKRVCAWLVLAFACGGAGGRAVRAAEEPIEAIAPGSRVTWDRLRRASLRAPEGWHRTRQKAAEFMGEDNPGKWAFTGTVLLYTGAGDVPPRPENVRARVMVGTTSHAALEKCVEAVAATKRDLLEKAQYTKETVYPGGMELEIYRSPARDKTRFFVMFPMGFATTWFVVDIPRPGVEFPDFAMKLVETLSYSILAPDAQDATPVPRRRP